MFYSTEILSLKNKTSLALIFYISTTDNKSKKIHKKEIEDLNINSTLQTLKNPPQPFALKLYSILIKGIVKVYGLKIKYYENEISSFYKTITFKEVKKRPKRKILKLEKLETKNINLDIFENKFLEMPNFENMIINETISNQFDTFEALSDGYVPVEMIKEKKIDNIKRIYDAELEIKEEKVKVRKIIKGKEVVKEIININNYYICNEFIKLLNMCIKDKNSSNIEVIRKESSVTFIPQTSNMKEENTEINTMIDLNEYNENTEIEINYNFEDILKDEEIIFNKSIKNWNKFDKGAAFLKMLEYIIEDKIEVRQAHPYDLIYINKK